MKKKLLAGTALAVAGVAAGPAAAVEGGIRLDLGGFFRTAYMVTLDDDSEGDLGNERNTDGIFNDAEIFFTGSTVLDNGLEVGARVELEGEQNDDQIDEAWIWFSGGFGEVRVGSDDDALANSCIVPPGGTGNFSAFSPNQWGANTLTSNSICTGVDDRGDSQKLIYISPIFAGFQLNLSYTPNGADEWHNGTDAGGFSQVGGPHVGMPANDDEESRHNVSAYLTYAYEGAGWNLTAGAGGSWEGHVEKVDGGPNRGTQDFYQAALNLGIGYFAVGGAFEYYNDLIDQGASKLDRWVAGIGAAYAYDSWTVGLQYSRLDQFTENSATADEFQQDRVVLTGIYVLGPGINLDGELGYTWIDTDPENGTLDGVPVDNYGAFEIGIGTNVTF